MSPPPTSTSSGEPLSELIFIFVITNVSYLQAKTEVILVIMKMDGLKHGLVVSGLTNSTAMVGAEQTSQVVTGGHSTGHPGHHTGGDGGGQPLHLRSDHQRPPLLPANSPPAIRD